MDLGSFQDRKGYPETLSLIARIELVESELRPKPSLAAWDSIFALPHR